MNEQLPKPDWKKKSNGKDQLTPAKFWTVTGCGFGLLFGCGKILLFFLSFTMLYIWFAQKKLIMTLSSVKCLCWKTFTDKKFYRCDHCDCYGICDQHISSNKKQLSAHEKKCRSFMLSKKKPRLNKWHSILSSSIMFWTNKSII